MRVALTFAVVLVFPNVAAAQGDPVGPEFRVNTYTTNNQGLASIAADGDGDFVVVWTSGPGQDGSSYGIFGQRYAASGAPQGPEFRVNTTTTNSQYRSSAAADSSGRFVVVWESTAQDGAGRGVFGQRYDASGAALGPEFRINTYTTGDQFGPIAAAASPSGSFVVVWHSNGQDGSGFGVFGQRYDASGIAHGSEFRVNTFTTGNQFYPSVAADSSNGFVVSWSSLGQDGGGYGIFAQRYDGTGSPLGPEFRANTYTTGSQSVSALASDPSGNFVVVWASAAQDGQDYGVFGQRFASSGAPLGPEFLVNSYTTDTQFLPAIAADSAGNFVVVWQSDTQDGSSYGNFGQRYAAPGMPLGPEFRVNSYTTAQQAVPSVAATDASGGFVVVWQSVGQDGASIGVFGQRYNMIVPVELMDFRVDQR
jgi:hypothetical protein